MQLQLKGKKINRLMEKYVSMMRNHKIFSLLSKNCAHLSRKET